MGRSCPIVIHSCLALPETIGTHAETARGVTRIESANRMRTNEVLQMMLKLPAVVRQTALSRSTIYAAIKSGDFPAPLRIGKRAVAWRVGDLEAWLLRREAGGAALPKR